MVMPTSKQIYSALMEQDNNKPYYSAYQALFDLVNEIGPLPTEGQMQDLIHLVHKEYPITIGKTYTEKQLVDFGNYLLSRKRFDSIWEGYRHSTEPVIDFTEHAAVVHQEDIDNALGESKTIPNI